MSLPFEIPPVIARQRHSEQGLYLRSHAARRVNMLREYAGLNPIAFHENDMVALAVEEVRAAHNSQLPPGQYSNQRGHYFEVDGYGRPTQVVWGRPQCGLNWRAGQRLQPPPKELLLEYQFAAGVWERLAAPYNRPFHLQGAAQQPQAPTFLPCAQFDGFVPPLQQQQQQHTPAAYGGDLFNFAALPQQYTSAAMQTQQPLAALIPALDPALDFLGVDEQLFQFPAADEQHYFNTIPALGEPNALPFAADEQTPSLPTIDEQPLFLPTANEQFSPFLPTADEQTLLFPSADEQNLLFPAADEQPSHSIASLIEQYGPSPVAPELPRACEENGDFLPWALDALLHESATCMHEEMAQQAAIQEARSTPAVSLFPGCEAAVRI